MSIQTVALAIIGIVGALIIVMSVIGVIRPDRLMGWVRNVVGTGAGIAFAVAVRVVLGASLLIAAPASAFEAAFTVLGWLTLAGALAVLILNTRLVPLMDWLVARAAVLGRAVFLLGAAVGVFLIYGVIPASS